MAMERLTSALQSAGIIKTPAVLLSLSDSTLSLPLRVVQSEDISTSATVANHAIADGSKIADHVVNEPENLSVSFLVTDVIFFSAPKKKLVDEVMGILQKMRNEKHMLVYSGVVFSRFYKKSHDIVFKPCVITSFAGSRNVQLGSGMSISLTLQKIKTAKSKITQNEKIIYKRKYPKKEEGRKEKLTKTEEGKVKNDKTSIMSNITNLKGVLRGG